MRHLLFGAAVIVGMGFAGSAPAAAAPLTISGLSSQSANVAAVEKIGWRRQYRRYGYPVPYAYYPPAYGYYAPPPAYAYVPPAYDTYAPPPAVDEFTLRRPPSLRVTIHRRMATTANIPRMASIRRTASMASIRPRTATDRSREASTFDRCWWPALSHS